MSKESVISVLAYISDSGYKLDHEATDEIIGALEYFEGVAATAQEYLIEGLSSPE